MGKTLAGTIETSWPFTAFGGENLIPEWKRIANEIPPTACRWWDIKLASRKRSRLQLASLVSASPA
jgi:hypothetical protein